MRDKIKRIADRYGFSKQSRQLTEECGELIQAVNKYYRHKEGLTSKDTILTSASDINLLIHNIVEEIADTEIMLEQIKYLLNVNPAAVEEIKKNKVNRQLERIKKETK